MQADPQTSVCAAKRLVSSTGARQGTALSTFLFTLYIADFQYNAEAIQGEELLGVNNSKYLGVHLDKKVNWICSTKAL